MTTPVVGIGASAGGLEAFSSLLAQSARNYRPGVRIRSTPRSEASQQFNGDPDQD